MINPVSQLLPSSGLDALKPLNTQPNKSAGPSFTDYLSKALDQVNTQQVQAER